MKEFHARASKHTQPRMTLQNKLLILQLSRHTCIQNDVT